MARPFVPPKITTSETPVKVFILRADPEFENAKRHEPFYWFSNGRHFDEDTSRQGAYSTVPNIR